MNKLSTGFLLTILYSFMCNIAYANLSVINDYTVGNTTTYPTEAEYQAIVPALTSLNASNLNQYSDALKSRSADWSLLTTDSEKSTMIQAIINAMNLITTYSSDSSNPAPTVSDYTTAGISGVNTDDLDLLNSYVGGQNVTIAQLPTLAIKIDNLNLLLGYSADSTNTEPIDTHYTNAGLTDPRSINTNDYNQTLVDSDFTTEAKIQALVDAINALDDYADGTTSVAPDVTTYHIAGFTDLRALHVELINNIVQTDGLNTLSSIASVIASLDAIQAYAIDSNATPPTLEHYTDLNLTGVSADILAYLNNQLIKEKSEGLTHYLKASDAQAGHQFGDATAMSRDGMTLAVLAWKAPSNNTTTDDAGAVYIYRRQGNSWQEVTILRTNQTINQLSEVVMSVDGRRVIASATNQAFVFDVPIVNDVPQWGETWSMTVVDHDISDAPEPSLAINAQGNIMAVGANAHSGVVKIYRLENSTWSLIQQLDKPTNSMNFSTHIDTSDNGDVIVVGAFGATGLGRAFAYRYNGMQWQLEQTLMGSEVQNGDRFGFAVSVNADGSRVALSSPRDDGETNAIVNSGAVYIYDFTNNSWQEIAIIRSLSPMSGGFGADARLSPLGDKLASVGYASQGVYVYDLSDSDVTNWQASEYYVASPSATNDLFGDRNNLSFNGVDVLVGADNDDRAFQGVVINSDRDTDFDAQDNTSTGTSFDNTSTAANNSGAAYVVAYEPYALDSTAALQTRIDAVNIVLAWAAGGATAPSEQNYVDAEITDVTASNLADVNMQLQLLAHVDMVNVQPMVNGINVIQAYAIDNNQPTPTLADYAAAGISGVNISNISDVNGQVDSQSLTPMASVQTMVDSLNIIQAYVADNTQTAPTVTNYADIGVTGVDVNNLSEVNGQVDSQSLTSVSAIQIVVDSLNVVLSYA
ncbi:FG-GAP repeat protein, partial [Aliivibrio finisterrensis]